MTDERAALAEAAALRSARSGEAVRWTIRPTSADARAALRKAEAEGGGGRQGGRRKAGHKAQRAEGGAMDEQAYADYLARIDEREAEANEAEGGDA